LRFDASPRPRRHPARNSLNSQTCENPTAKQPNTPTAKPQRRQQPNRNDANSQTATTPTAKHQRRQQPNTNDANSQTPTTPTAKHQRRQQPNTNYQVHCHRCFARLLCLKAVAQTPLGFKRSKKATTPTAKPQPRQKPNRNRANSQTATAPTAKLQQRRTARQPGASALGSSLALVASGGPGRAPLHWQKSPPFFTRNFFAKFFRDFSAIFRRVFRRRPARSRPALRPFARRPASSPACQLEPWRTRWHRTPLRPRKRSCARLRPSTTHLDSRFPEPPCLGESLHKFEYTHPK
jgi:hypothetical protein